MGGWAGGYFGGGLASVPVLFCSRNLNGSTRKQGLVYLLLLLPPLLLRLLLLYWSEIVGGKRPSGAILCH